MKIKTLSVSEVNTYIKKILDNDFILNNLYVKGEISNLKYHSSGHIYFSLKDNFSKVNCIMFKSKANDLEFKLEDGTEVVISGSASVYTAAGSFQLYCNTITKYGVGELHLKFEKLKNELREKGYFDEEHKKSLPENPQRIGVVTAETGAAIQDIKNVIRRRNSLVDILLYPAQVQGKDGYKTIIEGIKYFNTKKNVDVIIIGRGGGSIEELWNFNEKELALSVFNSKIPIISAVGHETDFTMTDFVADMRAATPSQAGEIVVSLESDIYNKIKIYSMTIDTIINNRFINEKKSLENYSRILELNSPISLIANSYKELDRIKERMDNSISLKIKNEKEKIAALNQLLHANSPLNILNKGYAIIEDNNREILYSKSSFSESNNIKIYLSDGYVEGTFNLDKKGENSNG